MSSDGGASGAQRRHRRAATGPRRALVDSVAQQAVWYTRYTMASLDVAHGAGYLFGAPASAPSLRLMDGVMPMVVWGGLLVAAGLAILAGYVPYGAFVAAVVWTCWAVFSLISLFQGTATGWGWPLTTCVAVMHLGMLWFIRRGRPDTARGGTAWTAG